jgi:hypothetical protein
MAGLNRKFVQKQHMPRLQTRDLEAGLPGQKWIRSWSGTPEVLRRSAQQAADHKRIEAQRQGFRLQWNQIALGAGLE